MKVTIRRMLAVVGVGIILLVGLAPPASAHDTDLYWRDNQAWVRGHTTIWVYDQVCNPERAVWTNYFVSTIGGTVERNLTAPCGSTATANWYPNQITKYRICETNLGCSGWKYT